MTTQQQITVSRSDFYHTPGPWMPQGQWLSNLGIVECVEVKDWGIIGGWIDRSNEPEGNFRLILAAPDLLEVLIIAADHLAQYASYSEAMREHGMGFAPSSDFSPDYLADMIQATLAKAVHKKT
jgi:hypothetical protein